MERVAIVGGGLAGFVAYQALLHGGVEPVETTVFDPDPDPAGAWRVRAAAIRQRRMRSESDGHCHATSFPGLAVETARRRRSLEPLLRSVCNRYHPTVEEFLGHVAELRERSRWDERVRLERVEQVRAVDGGFALDGGVYRHVLLAVGHPGLELPLDMIGDSRAVHAYQPHDYAADVAVVGAGMAAATEWLNALDAGARVTSVRRREPRRRSLNVDRKLFSRRGLVHFHATDPPRRACLLRELLAPSYPPGTEWDEPLRRARRDRRFRVAPQVDGEAQIVCATGFKRGYGHHPLLARLVTEHRLETHDAWLVLAPDSTVGALTDGTRTLAVAGAAAQWAYPAADTLAGARYAAHTFVRRVTTCPTR